MIINVSPKSLGATAHHSTEAAEDYGYQFKASSFVTNELIGPAVFFRMEIDPIRVTNYTERAPHPKRGGWMGFGRKKMGQFQKSMGRYGKTIRNTAKSPRMAVSHQSEVKRIIFGA